jgi:hypothetical protein
MALQAVDAELPRELSRELRGLAADVARSARARLAADTTSRSGDALASIRTFSTQRGAGVRAGKASVPYYGWLDFGGVIRHHGPKHAHATTHLIRREFISRGRYLYPAADERAGLIAPKVESLLDRMFVRAGFTD